jgi:hypothetical protein
MSKEICDDLGGKEFPACQFEFCVYSLFEYCEQGSYTNSCESFLGVGELSNTCPYVTSSSSSDDGNSSSSGIAAVYEYCVYDDIRLPAPVCEKGQFTSCPSKGNIIGSLSDDCPYTIISSSSSGGGRSSSSGGSSSSVGSSSSGIPLPILPATGSITFTGAHEYESEEIYYIGDLFAFTSDIEIDNASAALCGEVKLDTAYSEAEMVNALGKIGKSGTITVTASITCNEEPYELEDKTITVVPNINLIATNVTCEVGPVVLNDGATRIMHEDQTLTVNATVKDDYGRCTMKYAPNIGKGPEEVNTLDISEYANQQITPIVYVTCGTATLNSGCSSVFVAYHVEKYGNCTGNNEDKFSIKVGRTIFEFACEDTKSDYFLSCPYNVTGQYTVYVEGGSAIQNGGNPNAWNFPNLVPTLKDGLYYYPEPALVKTNAGVTGDLTCSIW